MRCFETEIQLLHRLDHQNVLRLIEIFEDANKFFIVTDLCQGGELFQHIEHFANQARAFPEDEVVDVVQQLLSVVNYLHSNGIMHLDLKPENILYISKDSN